VSRHFTPTPGGSSPVCAGDGPDAQEQRRRQVRQALRQAGGNKSRAAAALGVSRKTLYAWIREGEEGEA
jgi:transcriptional regulator with PAS, ATPase and Fis domain